MQLSPEQFHTLFDRAAQPVLLVQDGVITQCSSRAEGLIAPGSPIRELLPPDAVLQELIAAAPTALPLRLTLDFSAVTFMDSSGIAVAMRARQRMRELGGTARLVRVPAQPERVLSAAGIGKWMEIS